MAEEKAIICCMFQQDDANVAVKNRDLKTVEVLRDSPRREQILCRCKRCGGAVLYDYEEVANLNGDWDNADIFEHWYPVEIIASEDNRVTGEARWRFIEEAKQIYGHNMESDTVRSYWYQND